VARANTPGDCFDDTGRVYQSANDVIFRIGNQEIAFHVKAHILGLIQSRGRTKLSVALIPRLSRSRYRDNLSTLPLPYHLF
jgi:hypothetical protein